MNKHNFLQTSLLAGFAFVLMTFASCSGIVSGFYENNSTDGMGSISICLGENARTAYPILGTDFSGWKWTLKYRASDAQANAPWITLKEWAAGTVSAASGLNSPIGVPSGIWTFYLSGERIVGEGSEAQTVTTYSALGKYNDSTSINIAEAEATVSVNFNLVLTQLDTEVEGNGSLSITVNYTSSKVATVKGGLFSVPSFENDEAALVAVTGYALENLTISGSSVTYSKSEVPAGKYIAGFWFYDSAGNKLNKNPVEEYVHIVNGGNSQSTVTVSSLDDVYTITFVPAPSGTVPASFTRSSDTIKLPASTAIDSLLALDNSQTLFCGWYENSSFTGNPVTTIPAGTRGNKVFYGKYINEKEAQNLPDTLTLSYKDNGIPADSNNSKKAYVGNTIEISSASSIVPTCTYQWFADTAENIEASSNAISGATQASYKLVNANVGNAIKLKVSKTYSVSNHEESGTLLYHVVTSGTDTRSAVLRTCDSSGASTTTAAVVERAVLDLQNVTIQYSGKVVIGNKPQKSNLILSGALNDIYGNSISSGNLTGDFSDYSALSASKSLGVVITVEGYNVTNNSKDVFVTVQYAAPSGASLRTIDVVADTAHGESNLGEGKIAFTYATTLTGLQYSTNGSDWLDVTIAQFDKPNNLYVRYNSTGTAGQNGYIIASNSVTVPITIANVGTETTSGGGTQTVTENVLLLSGGEINDLFVANRFNNANSFEYTTSTAPNTAITISDSSSTKQVVAWKSGRKIYVTAKDYDDQIPLPFNSSGLFKGMNFKTIDLSHFCTKVPDNLPETIPEDFEDWYDFSEMFMDCYSLESIEFAENFDTRTV
ncbi:MAG: hypothetical protein K6A43_12235, partial [Treponema sp.]|nr:hypothetical protein [Treponema sp.]